jgi:hypothetical protein
MSLHYTHKYVDIYFTKERVTKLTGPVQLQSGSLIKEDMNWDDSAG